MEATLTHLFHQPVISRGKRPAKTRPDAILKQGTPHEHLARNTNSRVCKRTCLANSSLPVNYRIFFHVIRYILINQYPETYPHLPPQNTLCDKYEITPEVSSLPAFPCLFFATPPKGDPEKKRA